MNFFHWDLEFPQVFHDEDGNRKPDAGFDVVIGNPPWQILKPDIDEFFSPIYSRRYPDQKFANLTKNKKNAFVKKTLANKKNCEDYERYKSSYKKRMDFFNKSKDYVHQTAKVNGKTSSGDTNLYKLFTERSHQILKSHGYCGLVVPSGIYSDLGSKGLRELLLHKDKLLHLFSFINRKTIFKDVDSRYKFCVITFEKDSTTSEFLACFYLEDDAVLDDYNGVAYKYDAKIIQTISPDSLSFLECKNESEFRIFKKLFMHPLLCSDKWNFKASSEFHMTNNSNLFHTTKVGYPLYEGKMINMFTHTFAPPRYWIKKREGVSVLRKKEMNRMNRINKTHHAKPRIDSEEYRLVWRVITNARNTRTFITTILPPNVFLGHSLNYSNPISFENDGYIRPITYEEMLFLCGMFNSFPIDFILRHKVATNLTTFYIMELPIPKYDKTNNLHKILIENAAKLICTTQEYEKLLHEANVDDPVSEPEKRLILEAQINAVSAKIYNLTEKDLKSILDNFPGVDKRMKEMTTREFKENGARKN